REPTEEERAKEEELVGELFEGFVAWVAEARGIDEAKVREMATGEVFTGRRAATLGLVDEVGDRRRAVELAAELAGIPVRSVELAPPRSLLEQLNPAAIMAEVARSVGVAFARGVAEGLQSSFDPGGHRLLR